VAFVRKYKPVAELEAELFALCRDYAGLFANRVVLLLYGSKGQRTEPKLCKAKGSL